MKIIIHFDGGCRGNPGQMYGSFAVEYEGFELFRDTADFGHGTNNQAEFIALERALQWLLDYCMSAETLSPKETELKIFTDSTIVQNRINNRGYRPSKKFANTDGAKRMTECAARCHVLLDKFKSFTCCWNSREVNVEKFGH